eukprot:Seg4001.2 transcript_id=Seg4001.2/GoldUCD/mRNA.D3Y31 product="Ubiquitin-associated domain-containing protein 2" protein_id=Seg4001.2/GoldUCD/D3Y31
MMESRVGAKPDHFSRYGFEHAPLSKFLLIASGAATANFLLIPGQYSSLFHLHWPLVTARQEIWRLITSQLIYDSTAEFIYGSALLYNLRILERQWGTRKFASFILATCTLTLGSHFLSNSCDFIKEYFPVTETMASGLYGPIFALMIFYMKDVYSGAILNQNGFSITNKWMNYLIAFRMFFVNRRSFVAGILGLISGLAYRYNFLYVNDLLYVPRSASNFAQSVYNWFKTGEDSEPRHRKAFYGATEEIHDDIVYDYLSRLQTMRRGHAQNARERTGQGYADTLQPIGNPLQDLFDSLRMQNRPAGPQNRHVEHQNLLAENHERQLPNQERSDHRSGEENNATAQETNDTTDDDKIQRLVEMGFTREAVVEALDNTSHNIQEATNVLLSQ